MAEDIALQQIVKKLDVTEQTVEKVKNSNLDDNSKIIVLQALNKEIFEIRTMINQIQDNPELPEEGSKLSI